MTRTQGKHAGTAMLRALAAALAAAAALALAPTALAQGPWTHDGRNAYSFRSSTDAPASVGSLTQVWRRDFDSDVTGTPIVASNGGVYVGTWSGEVYGLLYSTGKTVWARGASNIGGPVVGSVLYANNTIFAAASVLGSPRLVALDPLTGDRKWSTVLDTQGDADVWGSPTYSADENLVYVPICACKAMRDRKSNVRTRGSLVAIDATTGAIVWKVYTVPSGHTGGVIPGTPMVMDFADRVYVATSHGFSAPAHPNTDAVIAYDTATGEQRGSFQAIEGDYGTTTPDPTKMNGFVAGPLGFMDGSAIRVGAGARNGRYYSLDHVSMAKTWEAVVGAGHQQGGVVGASAWNANSRDSNVFGTTSTPTLYWGLKANGSNGLIEFAFPGTDGVHNGPVSVSPNDYIWSTDTAGFLDIQAGNQAGRIVQRLPLGAPSNGGVSFGFRRAFVAIGTGLGTGGGIVSYR